MKPIGKIDTIFERKDDFTVDTHSLKRPVLATIAGWSVTEKVNGTSMRIGWYIDPDDGYNTMLPSLQLDGSLRGFVGGKSDNASIHPELLNACQAILRNGAAEALAIMEQYGLEQLTLYGEGYGAGIQKGGKYRPDKGFICFDVKANDTYLAEEAVSLTCQRLGVDRVPLLAYSTQPGGDVPTIYNLANAPAAAKTPIAGLTTSVQAVWPLSVIVKAVEKGFLSFCSIDEQPAEGIVARTLEPLYDNRGERLIIKLKASDFRKGKR